MPIIARKRNEFVHSMFETFKQLFPEIAEHITRVTPRDASTVTLTRDDGRKYMFIFCNGKWLLERIK